MAPNIGQRNLRESISRRDRREKELKKKRRAKAAVSVVVATSILGGIGFLAYNNLQSRVSTAETQNFLKSEARPTKAAVPNPEDPFSGPLNILLIGSDERDEKDDSDTVGMRSDTVMLAHVSADRERVELVSIPRDSWVTVPSCELPDGRFTEPRIGKFNAAFALGGQTGDAGAAVACTITTVEDLTGVFIDDYVIIDFSGFEGMVDALGGVEFNVEEEIIDPSFGNTHIKQGLQTFDGETALRYARVRKAQGMDGSDISRIGRQQELLSAIIQKAMKKTTDPAAMYNLVGSGLDMITTSETLGNLNTMAGFAWSMKDIDKENIVFKTVPVVDRGDGSNVVWTSEADFLWEAIQNDEPIEGKSFDENGGEILPEDDTVKQSSEPSTSPSTGSRSNE